MCESGFYVLDIVYVCFFHIIIMIVMLNVVYVKVKQEKMLE